MSPHKCGSSKMSIATGLRIWFEANMKLSQYLVGGFNHLEKYDFVNGKDYSHWWKIKFPFMESTNQICSHVFPCFQYFPAMFSSHVSNIFQPCFPMFPYFPMFPMFPYCSHQNGPPNTSKPVQRIMTNGPLCQAGISDMRGICGAQKNAMFVGL